MEQRAMGLRTRWGHVVPLGDSVLLVVAAGLAGLSCFAAWAWGYRRFHGGELFFGLILAYLGVLPALLVWGVLLAVKRRFLGAGLAVVGMLVLCGVNPFAMPRVYRALRHAGERRMAAEIDMPALAAEARAVMKTVPPGDSVRFRPTTPQLERLLGDGSMGVGSESVRVGFAHELEIELDHSAPGRWVLKNGRGDVLAQMDEAR